MYADSSHTMHINRDRNDLTKRLIRAKSAFHAGDDSVVSEIRDLESALLKFISREVERAQYQLEKTLSHRSIQFGPAYQWSYPWQKGQVKN